MASMTLTCMQCKLLKGKEIPLRSCRFNKKIFVYLCPEEGCLFPLKSREFYRYFYKQHSPGSELQRCHPSEVPKRGEFCKLALKYYLECKPEEVARAFAVNQQDIFFKEQANIKIEKQQSSKLATWKSIKELCWLHPTLCLLVHNKTFQQFFKSENLPHCLLKTFSEAYIKAASSLNLSKPSRKSSVLTYSILLSNFEKVLERIFCYLQPYMLCEIYKEETPVTPIVVLLKENINLHNLFLTKFFMELKCDNCGREEASQNIKTFVLIPGTVQKNENNRVISNWQCSHCRSEGQKITLQFHAFSPFLLMYFAEGLPSNDITSLDFLHFGQMYGVRGFVQHNQSNQHFVPWIRCDKEGKQWKCCDDLDPLLRNLTTQLPAIPASEIHIVMWEQRETSNVMDFSWLCSSWADFYEIHISESTKPTLVTLGDSDSKDCKTACNAQFQNTKEEILQPSKNLSNNKSVLEDCKKAVVEMKVSNADEKSESTICDVGSNSKNEAGVGESKNWNSSVDFESVAHDVEGCTDTETNTNDRLSRGGNIDSLSQVVKGMSISEMFAKKCSLGEKDADKEDSCSQSTSSVPKTSVKAQNHDDLRKTTFPVGGNAVERAPSGEPNNVSIGVVVSPLLHNMPFKKNVASAKNPSTEQAEASLVSGPVSGQDSYVDEPNTGNIHTGQVYHRIMNRYESEHKRTGENTLQTVSNIPVTPDAFTSCIIAEDQSVANSVKESTSVHPGSVLNDTSLAQLDSLVADFELKKSSPYKVISPMSSDSSFATPSADDSASPRNRKNSPATVIQHAEDLKTQQPNNLGIPSLKDSETEQKADSLRQMCKSAVSSSVKDHEEYKDGTQLAASDLQKTLKNGDPSNTTLLEFLGDISASKDLYQVTDQNLDLSVNNTASSDKDIKNSHTVTDKGRSFCSSELTFPKHSNLNIKKPCAKIIGQRKMNKKKPCAKVIGQRKTLENVTTIPKQVAMNENEASEIKVMSLKSKPDKTLHLDVSHGRCFQSKPVVDDSRHLPKATQGKSVNDKDIEPNSIKFVEFPVDTQLSVPECCIKDGGLSVNGYSSCRNETSLNSNEVLLRVTEAKSPKLSSGDTSIKSKYFAQSMCNAKKQAESKSLKKTGEVSHNAEENVLKFQDIVAVFHRIPENVISENAIGVSEVPCCSRKSKGPAVKKCINKNSTTQVHLSTSSVDLKTCNKPVKSAPQTASKRQRKSACSNEATEQSATLDYRKQQDAARSEQGLNGEEFYLGVKAMIIDYNAQHRVLNESQSSGSSHEKELGMVKIRWAWLKSACSNEATEQSATSDYRKQQKKCIKKNSTTQVHLSTSSVDLKTCNKPVKSAPQTASKRQRKSACSNEATEQSATSDYRKQQDAARSEQDLNGKEFYLGVKAMITDYNAQHSVLNESQSSGSSHEKELGMVKNHDESVSVCASASQDSTIGQKSHGRKRKRLKNEVQNEEKFPSLPENSDQSGTTEGIVSQNKMTLRKKTVRFNIYEIEKKCFCCDGIKAARSQSKTVSQPDILEDHISSGDNSVFTQTGDNQPAEGKSAETKDNSLKVAKKRRASILGVRKKRQSGKHLSPQPIVPIKRKSKNTGDAVNMNGVQQVQPSKSNAETQSENQCAASNSDISSEEKKCISPKTLPLSSSLSPENLSMNFQFPNLIPRYQVSFKLFDE